MVKIQKTKPHIYEYLTITTCVSTFTQDWHEIVSNLVYRGGKECSASCQPDKSFVGWSECW